MQLLVMFRRLKKGRLRLLLLLQMESPAIIGAAAEGSGNCRLIKHSAIADESLTFEKQIPA
jgi:hypothetical protein